MLLLLLQTLNRFWVLNRMLKLMMSMMMIVSWRSRLLLLQFLVSAHSISEAVLTRQQDGTFVKRQVLLVNAVRRLLKAVASKLRQSSRRQHVEGVVVLVVVVNYLHRGGWHRRRRHQRVQLVYARLKEVALRLRVTLRVKMLIELLISRSSGRCQ